MLVRQFASVGALLDLSLPRFLVETVDKPANDERIDNLGSVRRGNRGRPRPHCQVGLPATL